MFDKKLLSTLLVFSGIVLVIFLLRPLIPAFCLALILIYITTPLTNFFQQYVKKRIIATSASFLLISLSFVILSLVLLGEMIEEAVHLSEYLQTQEIVSDLTIFKKVAESSLIQNLLTENGLKLLSSAVFQLGNAALQLFFGLVISFFVVLKEVRLPVKDEKLKKVLSIIDKGTKSVVSSLLLTAVATGLISLPIYVLFGLPYSVFLAVLTGFLTLLPVIGAWLLYVPITGYLFFAEGITRAVIFLVVCAIFISTLPDLLVRPLAGKTKETGAIPLLIGFTCGLLVFGVAGIVLGPLIVIGALAFWKVYIEE